MGLMDDDGLPASEVGEWTLDKHERLRKYVVGAHGARRQFRGRTTYNRSLLRCGKVSNTGNRSCGGWQSARCVDSRSQTWRPVC